MIQASIIMICKFQSIYCINNSSVKSNDTAVDSCNFHLYAFRYIAKCISLRPNAFRYIQMYLDKLGLNENPFGTF